MWSILDLLPNTRDLLVLLLDGLDESSPNLPEVRRGIPGRSGCRFWLRGLQSKAFKERRPAAEFEELKSVGLLRKLRIEKSTGTYFAFTPAAFRERDAILKARSAVAKPAQKMKRQPASPPPELEAAESRLSILGELKEDAKHRVGDLLQASVVRDRFEGGGVITPFPWAWGELPAEHRHLLGAARDACERWLDACRTTLAGGGPEHLEDFDDRRETVRRMYIRSTRANGPASESIKGNLRIANEAIDDQFDLLERLPGSHGARELILVPDTNALLKNPDIESWCIGDRDCVVVIVSQVQAELDSFKAGERKIAEKAAKLIRRFKEYSRRGNTLVDVPLAGRLRFREIPMKPDMSLSPSWLEEGEPDDRILAAALEVAAKTPSSTVVLVTRDRGLQNKARAAELPAVDVDDL